MSELVNKLKKEIIEELNLQDIDPDKLDENTSLFKDGLGLDSIDALELIVLLQRNYGLKLASAEEGQQVFRSIRSMADYIESHQSVK
ncbi:MAG: acyl carrier protein [Opitutaceae bacterium]|nr:acyl carrier protein [Cytophagales bacterium]